MEEKIVTLASFPFTRALLLKGRLEAEGIDCIISNINLVQPAISTGVKIKVREGDLEKALKILGKIEKQYAREDVEQFEPLSGLRKILIPVDFSEYSVKAANFALDIAERLNAEIHLLHAYYNPVMNIAPFFDAYAYQANMDSIIESFELQAKIQLINFREKLLKNIKKSKRSKFNIKHSLIFGTPAETILYMADDYKPDIIIMGTKGKGDRADDIIGTVTNKIIENTSVPVLVIPEHFDYRLIDSMQNIAYVTDFDSSDYRALWKLVGLISPFNLKLHCLHISPKTDLPWNKSKMNLLRSHIRRTFPGVSLICDTRVGDNVSKEIQRYITHKRIHIISLTTHKSTMISEIFYPNLFKKMVFQSTIPILVFPSQKAISL